jgi:hypothetical protein
MAFWPIRLLFCDPQTAFCPLGTSFLTIGNPFPVRLARIVKSNASLFMCQTGTTVVALIPEWLIQMILRSFRTAFLTPQIVAVLRALPNMLWTLMNWHSRR